AAGLRVLGWVENQPAKPIEASIGRSSPRIVVGNPGNIAALPESQRALLAQASPDDVVDVRYQIWEYLGDNTTLDLADEGAFISPNLWRKVGINEVASGELPVLASTDGFADVQRGQWVEDRRTVLAVTLQIVDDLDIAAAGMVAANSEGELILAVDGDLQIDNGSRSGLTISGLQATGEIRVDATGGIYVVESPAITGAVIRSGGDLTLVARGEADSEQVESVVEGGVFRLGSVTVTGADGKLTSVPVTQMLVFDLPAAAIIKVDAAGDVSLERLSRETRGEASTLRTGGIHAGGDLTLKVSDGNLLASGRAWDSEVIHLSGQAMILDVIDTPKSNFTSVAIGSRATPLTIDADTLQARTRTAGASVIAVHDIDDLVIDGPGWAAMPGSVPVQGGLKISYDGSILVRAEGSIDVRGLVEMSFDPRGTVLFEALDGDLTFDGGSVLMGSGALSLIASGDIIQRGVSRIENPNSFSNAFTAIDIEAGGRFVQETKSRIATRGDKAGPIRIAAQGDIVVSEVDAGVGAMLISSAAGSVVEAAPMVVVEQGGSTVTTLQAGNLQGVNLIAGQLAISVDGSVGRVGRQLSALGIEAKQLALEAPGGAALTARGSVSIGAVSVPGYRVDWNNFGSARAQPAFELAGVTTGEAAEADALAVQDAPTDAVTLAYGGPTLTGSGSFSLRASGAVKVSGDVEIRGGGNLLLQSDDAITVAEMATVSVLGGAGAASGSLSLNSKKAITLASASALVTEGGDIDLESSQAGVSMAAQITPEDGELPSWLELARAQSGDDSEVSDIAAATIRSQGGNIRLAAANTLRVSEVDASGEDASGHLSLISSVGAIVG
ncbi:MAG: hypothetical protein EBT33_21365, partial [Betaproteobacteria bacterium]|nr:hypothetical protein [Betaproteobacteria bacterium]